MKKEYLKDTYRFDFSAKVIEFRSICANDNSAKYGNYKLILEATIFHPQGFVRKLSIILVFHINYYNL